MLFSNFSTKYFILFLKERGLFDPIPLFFSEQAANHEVYTYIGGQKEYVQIDQNDLYPYLLVNIGSGVSMIKVSFTA